MNNIFPRHITCSAAQQLARTVAKQQPINSDEKNAIASHLESCDTCRTDLALLKIYLNHEHRILDQLASKRCRETALSNARLPIEDDNDILPASRATVVVRQRKAYVLAAAAMLFAVLSGGAIGLYSYAQKAQSSDTPKQMPQTAGRDGNNILDENRSNERDAPTTSTMAETVPTGLTRPTNGVLLYAEDTARFLVTEKSAGEFRVQLDDGAIIVDVDPDTPHPVVSVYTDDGIVEVTGTIFRVVKEREFGVQVLRGKVRVRNDHGNFFVSSGHSSRLSQGAPVQMSNKQILQLSQLWKKEVDDKRHITSNKKNVAKSLNEPSSSLATRRPKPEITFVALIEKARRAKAQANYKGAIQYYKQLIYQYPEKPESKSALVTVGELHLKLGNARMAEKAFRRYEAQGHTSLLPEALLGLSTAYREQQNASEELRVLQRFLQRYPNSLQSKKVQARVAQLQ